MPTGGIENGAYVGSDFPFHDPPGHISLCIALQMTLTSLPGHATKDSHARLL